MSSLQRVVRLVLLCGATVALSATVATAASASVLFVNGAIGKDSNACTSTGEPCKTIDAAVTKSEVLPGSATIEVAAGVYQEVVEIKSTAADGIDINGVGNSTEIEGPAAATKSTVVISGPFSATLSNLSVVTPSGDAQNGIEADAKVKLEDVSVEMQDAVNAVGVASEGIGSLTIDGGNVTMTSGTKGAAVEAEAAPVSIKGTTVSLLSGATGVGVVGEASAVSLTDTTIDVGGSAGGAVISQFGPVTIDNVVVKSGSTNSGALEFLLAPVTVNGVTVAMENSANTQPGVIALASNATFEHLQLTGAWKGPGLVDEAGEVNLADSHIVTSPTSTAPAAVFTEGSESSRGILIQRSTLESLAATEGSLISVGENLTIDSSELLGGGHTAVLFVNPEGRTRSLTLAGSTVDAGALGVRDPSGVAGITTIAAEPGSAANANIEGSILLEPQKAIVEPGGSSTIACSYSDVPNQQQAATATEGAIACANGSNGNATTEPLTTLFGAPITNYAPSFGGPAIDSVPAGAISLPFGVTPSSTDLLGNPRIVDGNGDCVALQDRGAIELQGHSAPCPSPPAKPVVGSITNLSIAPNAFDAAPSGATIAKKKKAKKVYGATVSYKDSQGATTIFTVLKASGGRMQGKSCKKPNKANKHGKPCTIYTALGGFTHNDTAGANKFHFSGRLKGKKLAKGSYKLQAVPHNAAGNGAAVAKQFKIK